MASAETERDGDAPVARLRRALGGSLASGVRGRSERRADRRARRQAEDDRIAERFADRVSQQWQSGRERRQGLPTPIIDGPTRTGRAEVPYVLDAAAAWSWRLLLIALAAGVGLWAFWFLRVVSVPLVLAMLVAALLAPVAGLLHRRARFPRSLAALTTLLTALALLVLTLTFVGRQVADGFADLSDQVAVGLGQVNDWVQDGPFGLTDSQIGDALQEAQAQLTDADVLGRATDLTVLLGNIAAATGILLLSTYFFLAEGPRIWSWLVRIFPGGSRTRIDRSGRVAWRSLTKFVRATLIVAAVDAIGIMAVAAILDVPLVLALGVLVFLGAFVPVIGAVLTGGVAVLVALVAQGPVVALLMLAGVVVVQQVESNLLQPFLMGRFVAVHPLAVILAISVGVLVAGIIGALLAVPLVAAANAVITDLSRHPNPEPGQPLPQTGPAAS